MKARKIYFTALLLLLSVFSKAQLSLPEVQSDNYSQLAGCNDDSIAEPELFQTIYQWIGTPYCYSGDTKKGIDCSGFVNMLFKKVYNVELEESSADIAK